MKHFIRSLKYLRPYRVRIAIAIGCVIVIALLWGGGLGMTYPGAKILLSEEGLHGWAYRSGAEDRLGAKLTVSAAPEGTRIDINGDQKPQPVYRIINVLEVNEGSPGVEAGLKRQHWIIGMVTDGGRSIVGGEELAKRLSLATPGESVSLLVYTPLTAGETGLGTVDVTLAEERRGTAILLNVASWIDDPGADFSRRYPIFIGLLVFALIITAVRGVFMFFQEYLVGTAIWRGVVDLRADNYDKVLRLPLTYFSSRGVSGTMSRFFADVGELARGQNTLLGKTLVEPAKAVASLGVALYFSWQLTLMVLVAGPPSFWMIRKLGKSMHRASKRALESASVMMRVLTETLIGVRVVKAYTMENQERKRFFRVNRQLLKQQYRMERLDAATGPIVETLGIAAGMGAAAVAGYMVFVSRTMDQEAFLAWMVALFAMFDPVRKLSKVALKFQQSNAAAMRVFELQDTPSEVVVPSAPSLPRHCRRIEFRNVSLKYPGANDYAVRNANLTIEAGHKVAIVGPNGSGKTTLVSMVPRLLDPTEGTILIDGCDITQVSLRSLRRQIGLVTQDTVLFYATISENISYGLRRPKREEVLAASKKAFVDEFVSDPKIVPNGYETMVGEHGSTLSGGQRQRISIARAILRDPTILIFDEAMSQVDSDSERRITEAMEEFVKGRTTLMIAHRFATVLSADTIVVMDKGHIVDNGTHEELLGRCTLYKHLYNTQFVDSGG